MLGHPDLMSKKPGQRHDSTRLPRILLLLSVVAISLAGCTSYTVAVGQKGLLYNGFSFVEFADSKESLKAFLDANYKNDQQTKVTLYQAGHIHTVPAYTHVLVLESDVRAVATKVQFLDGEEAGMQGWVSMPSVHPLK